MLTPEEGSLQAPESSETEERAGCAERVVRDRSGKAKQRHLHLTQSACGWSVSSTGRNDLLFY